MKTTPENFKSIGPGIQEKSLKLFKKAKNEKNKFKNYFQ